MKARNRPSFILLALGLSLASCSTGKSSEQVVFSSSLDSIDDVLTRTGVTLDPVTSHDGRGSIRIDATTPTTVHLAEVHPEAAEDAALIYRAQLRTENVAGQAFLEMWCAVPGKGEFFSRALHAPLTGTTEWVSQETPFFLEKGQRAETVKLNVVVSGPGTVWVDDVILAQANH